MGNKDTGLFKMVTSSYQKSIKLGWSMPESLWKRCHCIIFMVTCQKPVDRVWRMKSTWPGFGHILYQSYTLNSLILKSEFPEVTWSSEWGPNVCVCGLPAFEPVTEGIDTLSQSERLHPVLLLLLPLALICRHRGELLDGGGCGNDDGVRTFSR